MKYFLDTEFIEAPNHLDLISIGIVAEDGRELYGERSAVDWSKASNGNLSTATTAETYVIAPRLGRLT